MQKSLSIAFVSLQALALVAVIPLGFLAGRTRWQYLGKPHRVRTITLQLSIFSCVVGLAFMVGLNGYSIAHPDDQGLGTTPAGAAALWTVADIANTASEVSLAGVWLQTAIALTQQLSSRRHPSLARWTRLVGSSAYCVIFLLAVVMLIFDARLQSFNTQLTPDASLVQKKQEARTASRVAALMFEICCFIYTATLIPLVLIQLIGRRTDKMALFFLLAANSFIDAEIILGTTESLYIIANRSALDSISSALGIACLFLQYAAFLMLIQMGLRDPDRLVDENPDREWQRTWWMRPYTSQDRLVELPVDEDHIVAQELAVAGNNDVMLDSKELGAKQSGWRTRKDRVWLEISKKGKAACTLKIHS